MRMIFPVEIVPAVLGPGGIGETKELVKHPKSTKIPCAIYEKIRRNLLGRGLGIAGLNTPRTPYGGTFLGLNHC